MTAATLVSIAVTPANPSDRRRASTAAVHGHRDLHRRLDRQPHQPGHLGLGHDPVATISSTGLAQSLATGTTNITAALGSVVSPIDTLTVTAPGPTVYTVTGIGDSLSDPQTARSGDLRYCLGLADANTSNPDGSLIQFDSTVFSTPQTITLGSGLVLTNTIAQTTITGPSASLTVSGGGPSSNFSVFTVNSSVTVSISGLTIANGNATGGGGIENDGTAMLTRVNITGNSAEFGGGVQIFGGTATLTNVNITGNSADDGGGVEIFGGTATLTNVTISANSVFQDGGGIYNVRGAAVTLTNVAVAGNSATDAGGGGGSGGGIVNDGTATLNNVTLTGNSATAVAVSSTMARRR